MDYIRLPAASLKAVSLVLILLITTRITAIVASSDSRHTGITSIFSFTLHSSNWTYHLVDSHGRISSQAEHKRCLPDLHLTSEGVLKYKSLPYFNEKLCQGDASLLNRTHVYLTVIAANYLLHADVSFNLIVTVAQLKISTKISDIEIIPHEELCYILNQHAYTSTQLNAFLPTEMHKSAAKLTFQDLVKSPTHSMQIEHTNIKLITSHCSKSRNKRQLFSNLHSPQFSRDSYGVTIREEISIATQVIRVTASDDDDGSAGAVRYSLHADADQRSLNVFQINDVTGWVTTKARVNREDITSHYFTVKARDQGSPSNSAQTALVITVEDINDHPPVFEQTVYNINVSETETIGSVIMRIRADDLDVGPNKNIVYSIVNAQAVTDFSMNRLSGDISIAKQLDRENAAHYIFVVKAEDQATNIADRLSSTVTANVNILDYNDNPPVFAHPDYGFTVREDINTSTGPVIIGEITATDADYGNNGIIKYSITYGNPYPRVFDIIEDTGQLTVITRLDRDRTGGDEYNLRIKARDIGVPSLSSQVNVKVIVEDVNDNAPSFRYPSYTYSVFEDHVPGVQIAMIEATDPDEGENRVLTYSISTSSQGGQFPIAINRNTGVLTNNRTLDRETTDRYEFTVRVVDSGDPPQSTSTDVILNVLDRNDNVPQFDQASYAVLISEDTAIQQEVTTVLADDPDENDALTYRISSGDPNDDFVIIKEQVFGVIRVNKALSYDRQKYYSLAVQAIDTSGKSSEATVQVNVTDKNRHAPIFRESEYTFRISEAAQPGDLIGRVQADDADVEMNGQIIYFVVNNGLPLPFMINNNTGEIIVNDTLDRDNPGTQEFHVDVIASDRGIPKLQTDIPAYVHIFIQDINDNAPVFSQSEYTASISEDKSVGSSVITVSATDRDKPGTPNSQVRYTFTGGDNGNGSFYVEYAGGTIRVNNGLDRETVSEYDLIVNAIDMNEDNRQVTAVTVRVSILDVNDNAPSFESDVIIRRIYENERVGSVVTPVIVATDADDGTNAEITFQLVGGDTGAFELRDLGDGSFKLFSKVALDYESLRKNYTLEVQASSEHMITKATVIVKLQDVNDNSPELKNFTIVVNNYKLHFPEGPIGRVPAFDPDETDRANLRYTVKSGNANQATFFTLNSTGYITLNKNLDSDRPTEGEFIVQVSDVLNTVNATCRIVYRLITNDMLVNSVTLRLDDITATSFMTSMYGYTVQALAEVLRLLPSQIYIIDIKEDTEVDTQIHNPVLNISFAAVRQVDDKDVYLSKNHIKEQIYRRLDLLKNLSAVTILPFDDTLCVLEPCLNYKSCSIDLQFSEAASFISSEAMLFRPIRTQSIYSCSCPQGFGGQNTSYSCDTEINLCYSDPCMNGGTCQQIEAGYTCICPTEYKGDRCQYDTITASYNKSTCPGDVCSGHGSYCVDLLRGGFACHQGTARCEETDSHTDTCALRTASFVPGSYLMFPSMKSRARFNIQISFATRKKAGLLLYNGRYNHQHDFIALELINHTAVFSMSFGDQTYQVSVGKKYGLNDGQWHTLNLDYKDWRMVISLDECDVGLSLANPQLFDVPCAMELDLGVAKRCLKPEKTDDTLCALDLTGPLFVGGLPEYLRIDRLHSSYFVGCIRDFHMNFELVDYNLAVTDHNTQEGCVYKRDYCINSPCRNSGTCFTSWSTYQCECPSNKAGKDCSIQTASPYTFYGIGHLQYSDGLEKVRRPWYNSFMFKTSVDNRLVMKIDIQQDRSIEYRLESGYITFRYADFYYIFDEAFVNDDSWHHFEMRLLSNSLGIGQLLFQLDYGDIQKSEPLDNSLDNLDILNLWVGGDENTNQQNLGFSGCIKDIRVGTSLSSTPLQPTRRDDVANGCTKPTRCTEQCPAITSVCQIGWEESKCVCNEGLIGLSCISVCSSQYNPCSNGAQCRIDRATMLGYRCVCPKGYQGTYCQDKIQTQCPASWWGSPVCGPCNCSTDLDFDSQCNRVTGACVCKTGYYRPAGSARCVQCNCYYNSPAGGALSLSCDQTTGQCSCKEGVQGRRCDQCENEFAEITNKGCAVQYGACPRAYKSDIWWTRTRFGVQRIEPCPAGSYGNATRICKDNVQGWLSTNLGGCTSTQFLALNNSLYKLLERREDNTTVPVYAANSPSYTFLVIDVISSLRNATQQVSEPYSNDLLMAVRILREVLQREKMGQSFDLTNTKDRYFLENLVEITSSILEPRPAMTTHWIKVISAYKTTAVSELLQDYDDYIANLADNMATKFVTAGMDPFQIVTDNMVIGVDSIRENGMTIPKYNNVKKPDSLFDEVTSVKLPVDFFRTKANGHIKDKAVAGYILYRTAGELMESVASQSDPYSADITLNPSTASSGRHGGVTVNSVIFSLVLQQGDTKPSLTEPLEITYRLRDTAQTRNPQCVYLNDEGQWTSNGCVVKSSEGDQVVCSCTHLSTYALITDYYPNTAGLVTEVGVHMYVAVALALFCFLFTLLVFICLKDFKSNYIYNQINIQLCFCLALIVFISGSESMNNEAICTVVAVLIQFFVLSLFAWIFVNALHLYRILTEKRHIDGEAMLLYVLIGYVGPGIVTGLSVGLSPESFGTEKMCWLSVEDQMIWSLAGPAWFCCGAVAILLALCVAKNCQHQTYETTAKKNDAEYFKSAIWISSALMPLTKGTWLFALLAVNSTVGDMRSYDYMFSAFACVTAIFSLLAHVIFNKRGRSELQKRWKRCHGHKSLEDSDFSDNPHKPHIPFGGDFNAVTHSAQGGGLTLAAGSESSTTSNSRLTGAPSDLLGYLRNHPSSTSTSDVHTGSHHRRRRRDTDGSSDSETDSDIRTEREKDIELASSHSSDDDDPIPPVTLNSINPIVVNTSQHQQAAQSHRQKPLSPLTVDRPTTHNMQSTPMVNSDLGYAPPPPYFITPNAQWTRRLSDSTDSTHGSQSRVDTASVQSTVKNMGTPPPPPPRPNTLSSFTGGRTSGPSTPDKNQMPSPSADASPFYHQHTNKSFVNSPSIQDRLTDSQQLSPTKSDYSYSTSQAPINSNTSSLRRLKYDSEAPSTSPIPQNRASPLTAVPRRASPSLASQHRVSPLITNQQRLSPLTTNQQRSSPLVTNQHRASPLVTPRNPSVDRLRTTETDMSMADGLSISTQSSNQDDVFMPPPPDSATLTLQPGSGYSTLQRSGDTDLDDVNNETQV